MKTVFAVALALFLCLASCACAQKVTAAFERENYQLVQDGTMCVKPVVKNWSGRVGMKFATSNAAIADVDPKSGVVTAKKAGTVQISCTVTAGADTFDLSYRMLIFIKIRSIEVQETRVTLNAETMDAETEDKSQTTFKPVLIFKPEDATFRNLAWTSSNEAVAKVNAYTGRLTVTGLGHALITGKVKDHDWHTVQYRVIVPQVTFTEKKIVIDKPEAVTVHYCINMGPGSYDILTAQDGGVVRVIEPKEDSLYGTGTASSEYMEDEIVPRKAGKGRFIVYVNSKGYSIPVEVTKSAVDGVDLEELFPAGSSGGDSEDEDYDGDEWEDDEWEDSEDDWDDSDEG